MVREQKNVLSPVFPIIFLRCSYETLQSSINVSLLFFFGGEGSMNVSRIPIADLLKANGTLCVRDRKHLTVSH